MNKTGSNKLYIGNSKNNTLLYGDFSNGRIGIGTTEPEHDLDIGSSNYGLQKGDVSPNAGYLRFGDNTGWKFHIARSQEGIGATFNTDETGALVTFQDNGNVGIGTTSPINLLDVRSATNGLGAIELYDGSTIVGRISDSRGVSGAGNLYLYEFGTSKVRINSSGHSYLNGGNVGIGTTTPSRKLFVNGDAGGTTGWFNDSDARLKKNVVTINNALERVGELRGVQFEWKDTVSYPEGKQIGFVAQEARNVIPEEVSKKGKHMSMQYGPITALLVEAVKELKVENDTIKAENTQLKEKLTALTDRQEAIEDMLLAISTSLQNEKLVKYDNAGLDEVQKTIQ